MIRLLLCALTLAQVLVTSGTNKIGLQHGVSIRTAGNAPTGPRMNVGLGSNGGVAGSTGEATNFAASGAVNGNHTISDWGSNGGWSSSQNATLEVHFARLSNIDEIDVYTYGAASEPTLSTTFGSFGATAYSVEYLSQTAVWTSVTSVTGNDKVWRQFTFTAVNALAVRVTVTNSSDLQSRIVELEAWGRVVGPLLSNVAAASNGATAAATDALANFAASGAINGNRTNADWGSNGGWASSANVPQTLTVTFATSKVIRQVNVITYGQATAPATASTFPNTGASAYTVEYWNGSSWVSLGSVSSNNKIWVIFRFSQVATTQVRVTVTASSDSKARIIELEALGT